MANKIIAKFIKPVLLSGLVSISVGMHSQVAAYVVYGKVPAKKGYKVIKSQPSPFANDINEENEQATNTYSSKRNTVAIRESKGAGPYDTTDNSIGSVPRSQTVTGSRVGTVDRSNDTNQGTTSPTSTGYGTHPEKGTDGTGTFNLKDWKFTTNGGLSFRNPKNDSYWTEVKGNLRLDQTFFSGSHRDKRRQVPNSGYIRRAEGYVDSGLGQNWLSSLGLVLASSSGRNRIEFNDTWVGYTGFAQNNEVNIGRNSGNWFGLDNSTGTTWNAFMERSLQAFAFYPGDGMGVLTDMWWKDGQVTLVLTQPDHGTRLVRAIDNRPYKNDRWRAIVRASYSPVHELGNVWHFGVSFAHRRNDAEISGRPSSDEQFAVRPGLQGRRVGSLISTPFLNANYARQYNVEFARQCGAFMLEAEFSQMYIHRVFRHESSLRFHGWNLQARYMLTGQPHHYDVRDGSFGKVDVPSPYGAYELVARYDYLSLNDHDIRGGSQHNASVGFNWFINQQVRFSINYIRANIHASRAQVSVFETRFSRRFRRHLDIIGVRLQASFK